LWQRQEKCCFSFPTCCQKRYKKIKKSGEEKLPQDRIAIIVAKRTPIGAFQGAFTELTAPQLGGYALKAALAEVNLQGKEGDIDELFMGCVLQAGLGQNSARQVGHYAGLPYSVGATTLNKVCGSGMKAIMLGYDLIQAGVRTTMAVGGMESMTNAPYFLPKGRSGYRFGHGKVIDSMMRDGLEDAYQQGCAMGVFAENTAEHLGFSREEQDQYVIRTTEKTLKAMREGWFKKEIVSVSTKSGDIMEDETPLKVKPEKIPLLKAAFREGGTVTAASSSSIGDGAAILILMSEKEAKKRNLPIRAYIVGHATHSQEPEWFTLALVQALARLLKEMSWSKDDVDLYEINEAFAVVTMAAVKELKLDPSKVNLHGGACALGHPIGASGSRIVVTLLHALETHHLKRGIASLCIGGGEATALAIERP
jgi:acetyl-CoA C-acetyltransferase